MEDIISKYLTESFCGKEIDTTEIIISPDIIKYCRMNHCGMYGKSWTCPPAVGDYDTLKAKVLSFRKAYIIYKVYTIEDFTDIEGMELARQDINGFCNGLINYLNSSRILFYPLTAGSCSLCGKCSYPEPCIHPDKAFPSIEAMGIDMVSTAEKNNIKYYNGQNTITYFVIILYN